MTTIIRRYSHYNAYKFHNNNILFNATTSKQKIISDFYIQNLSTPLIISFHSRWYNTFIASSSSSSSSSSSLSQCTRMNISSKTVPPLNQNTDNIKNVSNRTEFKSIPIHQATLSYIKSIGVGIRPKKKKRKTFKILKSINSKGSDHSHHDNIHGPNKINNDSNYLSSSNYILSTNDEKEFLKQKYNTYMRRKPSSNKNKINNYETGDTNRNNHHDHNNITSLLPPPPFSSFHTTNETINKIKRLPVKIIGSVGSVEEPMPRSSKGLPEVAIIGRSNVGKSTLLNALLYGNQENVVDGINNKTFVRGKTPMGAKIAKGTKAVVSNIPGETKKITFYQLTAQLHDTVDKDTDVSDAGENNNKRSKMSLVLVDLPGYGFAYTSEEKANSWLDLMNYFLINREKSLKRILLLIDARHGFKKADFDFLRNLQSLGNQKHVDGKSNASGNFVKRQHENQCKKKFTLPPIQVVLTKCDLVHQDDLARRVVQVREQLSDILIREPSSLPVMLCSAKAGLGYNNVYRDVARGGILEIQRELAALVPSQLPKL